MRTHTSMTKQLLMTTALVTASFAVPASAGDSPFQIRVGHDHTAADVINPSAYMSDADLRDADIQIRSDNLVVQPYLNVTTHDNSVTALRSQPVKFHSFWNYGAFIERAEVRIFAAGESVRSNDVIAIPVVNGIAALDAGAALPDEVTYVMRVYDSNGRFDETLPKFLNFVDSMPEGDDRLQPGMGLDGYGIDRTASRNIKVRGTSVTVSGRNVPQNGRVTVMGLGTPIDLDGKFQREMILPYGEHNVDVQVQAGAKSVNIRRDLYLDESNFFYVSLGDLTLGSKGSVGPADFLAATDEDFDDVSLYGRGAMYAKGVVKGDYRVTAAIDTGEDRLADIFNNLDEKDPRQLLRRLDGDRFYPVYGDDSQIVDDAPTQGKFYVRVEKNDSHIMWGNYATQITGTEFAHLDRGLYGGIADYRSEALTSSGDRRTHVTVFAADPGTVPAREEFRGTGGSLYFLQRQDVTIGSERVRVEVRDKISGLVVETRDLAPQNDYDIDYIQGRVVLSNPLSSYAGDNEVVRTSSLSGNEAYLVVRYEYTPSLSDVDGYTLGGRGTHWLGDHVRIGATAQEETTDFADQTVLGADLLLRQSDQTYLKLEYARTEGLGFGQSNSVDGGFNFNNLASTGVSNIQADAYRAEASVDLSDVIGRSGRVSAYYDHQDAGFSGAGRIINGDLDRWGAYVESDIGSKTNVNLKYDEIDGSLAGSTRSVYGGIVQQVGDKFSLSAGLRHDDRDLAAIGSLPAVDGSRTDVTLQANYQLSEHFGVHGFAQKTLEHDATRLQNDRYGVGADVRVSERVTLSGEISDGDLGLGGQAQVTLQRPDNSEFYLGYALTSDNRTTGLNTQVSNHDGTLTVGGRKRFNDSLSVFGEERYGHGRGQTSLSHAYGLNFNPNAEWSFGASIENGTIESRATGEAFERTAVTLSAGRASDNWRLSTNMEGRFEDSDGALINRDRTTLLMRNTFAYDASENWEMLGRFNFAISESDEASFLDSDFVEGVLGAAYRPVENDRLNALLKYTYFEDLAPASQITSGGTLQTSRQKSQVLSVDAIYDVTEKLSIGGKYGFRSGEVALTRTSNQFVKSDAHLGVIRADYHVVQNWDVLAEARWLSSSLSQDERFGALAGVYRHLGDHAKVGVGYNFGSFSDDLTNFDEDSEGFFINMVGKF